MVCNENLCYLLCSCTNFILGKILFLRYRPKCESTRLRVKILVNEISGFLSELFLWNKLMKQSHFLHVDTNSQKLKVDWKFLGWTWSKMGVVNLVSRLFCMLVQIRANKSCLKIFGVVMIKYGCGYPGDDILKLTLSQKWTDAINWFFVSWYKFRKTKSWFYVCGVGMVKNGHNLLVHEPLKSTVFLCC